MNARYHSRIAEHIRMASSELLKMGEEAMTMKRIAADTGIPYTTVRRYSKPVVNNPTYAVSDRIRRYLNQFYQMPEEGYLTPVDESLGQPVGVGAI